MVSAQYPSVSVVIPSIREAAINDFLRAWGLDEPQKNVEVIVVEDNERKSFLLPTHVRHFSREDFKEFDAGGNIFSKHNSAIRCFGFLKATKEFIITLDDDCYPTGTFTEFADVHWGSLTSPHPSRAWDDSVGFPTRGFPYKNLHRLVSVAISHGGWLNIPDFDSPQQLSDMRQSHDTQKSIAYKVIPRHQYFPMCGMNLAFPTSLRSILYFPQMGSGQPYDRFEDIWAGILAKRVLDEHGMYVVSGCANVIHSRLSNVFKNLKAEARGIGVNELFWHIVDTVELQKGVNMQSTYENLGAALTVFSKKFDVDYQAFGLSHDEWVEFVRYINSLGTSMKAWSKICQSLP